MNGSSQIESIPLCHRDKTSLITVKSLETISGPRSKIFYQKTSKLIVMSLSGSRYYHNKPFFTHQCVVLISAAQNEQHVER
ncbi:BgTH12-01148 [Blumeria graminis f. sp. triticale]|uniref:BgTH12-01148 n=1 Tax=Blumeria graminis f. sp. triticale TaxID=1689686 RepID=A0A9W4GI78_BLUGR|nr:BgTH12-01148 [Blumeria graminis f. sp. triticale]